MAKLPNTVIGVDLGRFAVKSVVLQRKGPRFILSNYSLIPVERPLESAADMAEAVSEIISTIGSGIKHWGVAGMHAEAVIRIIEQPETPTEVLRDAVRLNGMALLNQDVRNFVLDCAAADSGGAPETQGGKRNYLIGAMPRDYVSAVGGGFHKVNLEKIQLGAISVFNAFEFAKEDVFTEDAFMLLDIGYGGTNVIAGVKGGLILVRNVDFGSRVLLDGLANFGGVSHAEALAGLEKGDSLLTDCAHLSLAGLAREVSSSIGFFEGRREESISKVYVCGGVSQSKAVMEILATEMGRPCETWNPFARCEVLLPSALRDSFAHDAAGLHVACGVAAEMLKSN